MSRQKEEEIIYNRLWQKADTAEAVARFVSKNYRKRL